MPRATTTATATTAASLVLLELLAAEALLELRNDGAARAAAGKAASKAAARLVRLGLETMIANFAAATAGPLLLTTPSATQA